MYPVFAKSLVYCLHLLKCVYKKRSLFISKHLLWYSYKTFTSDMYALSYYTSKNKIT